MTTNPIFNDNKLKLGTFCTNGRAGAAHTLVPEGNKLNWPHAVEIAQKADRAGYEAVVPLAGRSAGDLELINRTHPPGTRQRILQPDEYRLHFLDRASA